MLELVAGKAGVLANSPAFEDFGNIQVADRVGPDAMWAPELARIVATFTPKTANQVTLQIDNADSVFQFGSITKTWTATLVMQLVDEGLVDLDAPLSSYLPSFAVASPSLTTGVTVRSGASYLKPTGIRAPRIGEVSASFNF